MDGGGGKGRNVESLLSKKNEAEKEGNPLNSSKKFRGGFLRLGKKVCVGNGGRGVT